MIKENGVNTVENKGKSGKPVQAKGITNGPISGSEKVYVGDLRVPMRKISQSDSPGGFSSDGKGEPNPPIYVYDCSGPYTDHNAEIDIYQGLKPLRHAPPKKWHTPTHRFVSKNKNLDRVKVADGCPHVEWKFLRRRRA